MWLHRLAGALLTLFGLTLLALQLALLYGSTREQALMVAIGLPGTAVLSSLGAVCFAGGCLLMSAPRATVRHARRAASVVRRTARP